MKVQTCDKTDKVAKLFVLIFWTSFFTAVFTMAIMNKIVLSLLALNTAFFVAAEALNCVGGRSNTDSTGSFSQSLGSNCSGAAYCYTNLDTYYNLVYYGCASNANFCGSKLGLSCILCSTDYCNSPTPSSIRCYYGSYVQENCATAFTTCYYNTTESAVTAGCGRCNTSSDPSCRVCSTNLCNGPTPSVISCYQRNTNMGTYNSPGNVISCHQAFTSCSSYTTETVSIGSCGSCSIETNPTCSVTCNTSLCNTLFPTVISCYYRSGTLVINKPYNYQYGISGTITPCPTGVTSCFSYLVTSSDGYYNSYGGCGVCNSTALRYGCKTCDSPNCNSVDASTDARKSSTRDGANVIAAAAASASAMVLASMMNKWI